LAGDERGEGVDKFSPGWSSLGVEHEGMFELNVICPTPPEAMFAAGRLSTKMKLSRGHNYWIIKVNKSSVTIPGGRISILGSSTFSTSSSESLMVIMESELLLPT